MGPSTTVEDVPEDVPATTKCVEDDDIFPTAHNEEDEDDDDPEFDTTAKYKVCCFG